MFVKLSAHDVESCQGGEGGEAGGKGRSSVRRDVVSAATNEVTVVTTARYP